MTPVTERPEDGRAPQRRGDAGSAAASHGFAVPGSERANGLERPADGVALAGPESKPASFVLAPASSDDLACTPGTRSPSALAPIPSARSAFRRRWDSIVNATRRDPGSPRSRPATPCRVHLMVFEAFPSPPLAFLAKQKSAEGACVFSQIATRPAGRWVASVKHDTGPAVKTSNPRLSPRGATSRRRRHPGLG